MKWIEIKTDEHKATERKIGYSALVIVASGVMLNGGNYTEYGPSKGAAPVYRYEIKDGVGRWFQDSDTIERFAVRIGGTKFVAEFGDIQVEPVFPFGKGEAERLAKTLSLVTDGVVEVVTEF